MKFEKRVLFPLSKIPEALQSSQRHIISISLYIQKNENDQIK